MNRCFWCDNDFEVLTDDHILPWSLGGTSDFRVLSCKSCQQNLSKAELETVRKSTLAIPAITFQSRKRHPRRPTSGLLQPRYLLVKHPLGGYGEAQLTAGGELRSLPHLEIGVESSTGQTARVRGPSAEEAQRLLDLYRKKLQLEKTLKPGELVCELTYDLTLQENIASDPDFWPRIVLLPGDRLMFRARNIEELDRFVKALEIIARSNYVVDLSRWKQGIQIAAGTPHAVSFRFDPRSVCRVVAKIAYGLFRSLTKHRLEAEMDEQLRRFILGTEPSSDEHVLIAPLPVRDVMSIKHHYIILSPSHDRSAAFVRLYNSDFRVELGSAGVLPKPIIVICAVDGSGMRIGSEEEVSSVIEQLKRETFSGEWFQDDGKGDLSFGFVHLSRDETELDE